MAERPDRTTEHHTRLDYTFAPVPEALICDGEVSSTAVRIWGLLARFGLSPESCVPSQEEIARRLEMGARSVARPLKELEEQGWLTRFPRFDERGRTSDGYQLHARKNARENRAETAGTPRAESRGEIELQLQEKEESLKDSSRARAVARSDLFDEFWAAYPLKTGKRAARKAWDSAVRRADPDRIVVGARRYAEDPNRDPSFTKHPQGWLSADRWEDEPLPPRSDGRRPTATEQTIANLNELMSDGGGNGNGRRPAAGDRDAQRGLPRPGR